MSANTTYHAAALARALRHAGDLFVFGGVGFSGVLGAPKPDDPRLQGAADRTQLLTAEAAELDRKFATDPRPKAGDIVVRSADSAAFLISRVDRQENGSIQFLVTKS